MASNGWENFYGSGENPKGLVAQLPNNTTVNAGWYNNDMGDVPPNPDPTMNENIPAMVKVREYERKPPSKGGPTIQETRRRR